MQDETTLQTLIIVPLIYLGAILTNQNSIQENIKSRLKSGNV
jgi:hypothetical protein